MVNIAKKSTYYVKKRYSSSSVFFFVCNNNYLLHRGQLLAFISAASLLMLNFDLPYILA